MPCPPNRPTSVLIVDNDFRFVDSLKTEIPLSADNWLVRTARNGEEALQALSEAPTDIIIANLTLPKLSGDIFLAHAKREYPNSLRILIHEPEDLKSLKKGTGLAHRYISKPFTAESLTRATNHTLFTHLRIRRKEVITIIRETEELHLNTQPMQELLQSADDPNCDIEDLVPIIMRHPTAVATILQVANTAFFGSGGRIDSIEEAIQMLGMDFVRNLAITELAKKQLALPPGLQEIANAVLKHSIETSQYGFQMRKFGATAAQAQTLSSLSLLHDLGKLVLLANQGEDYADIMGRSIENNRPCWRLEQAVFGCDHASVGAFLFAMWGLPENIIRAVAWHHEPQYLVSNRLCSVSLLHFANCAAHAKHEMPFYYGDELNIEIATNVGLPLDYVKELD